MTAEEVYERMVNYALSSNQYRCCYADECVEGRRECAKKDKCKFYQAFLKIGKALKILEILEEEEMSDETKIQPINRSEAYKIVFDDLIKCNMFKGIYDAKNGKPNFMNGIWTVMECIASKVSDDCYEQFTEEFVSNMVASKAKAE